MRITHVITDLGTGGAEIMLEKLIGNASPGVEHSVLSLGDIGVIGERLQKARVPVRAMKLRAGRIPRLSAFRIGKILTDLRPDLIQGWMYHGNLAAAFGHKLSASPAALSWSIRCSLAEGSQHKILTRTVIKANAILSHVPGAIIYNSSRSRSQHEGARFSSGRACVIPNGFELEKFAPDRQRGAALKAKLGIRPDKFVVGTVGRSHSLKDHYTFLRSAELLSQSIPNVIFIIAGRDVPSLAHGISTQELVTRLGAKLLLLGEQHDICSVMNAFDVFVLSSIAEGFPNALGEAMACGVPCVTTDVGDCATLVGETGRVVQRKSPQQLAEAVLHYAEAGAAQRQLIGMGARKRIQAKFDIKSITSEYEEAWVALVAEAPRKRVNLPVKGKNGLVTETKPGAVFPVRVTHLITSLDTGGAEMMLEKVITRANPQFVHNVICLQSNGIVGTRLARAGISVETLDLKPGRLPGLQALRLRALLNRAKPDLIQGWMYHGNMAALFGRAISKRDPHLFWSIRCSLSNREGRKALTNLVVRAGSLTSSRAEVTIFNAERSKTQHESIGYRSARNVLIPNGFDVHRFKPDPVAREIARSKFGITPDQFVVGNLARLHPMKDHENLILAAKAVASAAPQAVFMFAGRGVSSLSKSMQGAGLSGRFYFLDEVGEVPEFINGLDTLVVSSQWGEGFSNVLGEAMSCAVPCVTTDVGDCAAIVGGTGIVVSPGRPKELADAIKRLIDMSANERADMGARARQVIVNRYSLDSISLRYELEWLRALGHAAQKEQQ